MDQDQTARPPEESLDESLCYVREQDTFPAAYYWFNPGKTEKLLADT